MNSLLSMLLDGTIKAILDDRSVIIYTVFKLELLKCGRQINC